MNGRDREVSIAGLRRSARASVGARKSGVGVRASRLKHELEVHQVELEVQIEAMRRTQAELEESRDRYYELFDLAPVAYMTIDANGRILECNSTTAEVLDVPRGRLLSAFLLPREADRLPRFLKRVASTTQKQGDDFELTSSDRVVRAHIEAVAVPAVEGRPFSCRCVIVDLSAPRRADSDATVERQREEQHRYAQKMEAIGALVGSVAHDFNSVLQSIIGLGWMALKKDARPAEIREHVEALIRTARRGGAIAGRLTSFARHGESLCGTQELELPLSCSSDVAPPSRTVEPVTGKVLLVEDEPVVRTTIRQYLEKLGLDVVEASNGEEGRRRSAAEKSSTGLLVTDVVMPGMQGTALAGLLQANKPELRVLFVTAHPEDIVTERPLAGRALLRKPFDRDDLGAVLGELLRPDADPSHATA